MASKYSAVAKVKEAKAAMAASNEGLRQTLLSRYSVPSAQPEDPVIYPSGQKDQPMRAGEKYFTSRQINTEIDALKRAPVWGRGLRENGLRDGGSQGLKDAVQADADWDKYFQGQSQSAYNKRFQTKKQPEASTPVQQRNLATSLGGDTLMARYGL